MCRLWQLLYRNPQSNSLHIRHRIRNGTTAGERAASYRPISPSYRTFGGVSCPSPLRIPPSGPRSQHINLIYAFLQMLSFAPCLFKISRISVIAASSVVRWAGRSWPNHTVKWRATRAAVRVNCSPTSRKKTLDFRFYGVCKAVFEGKRLRLAPMHLFCLNH